MDEVNIIDLIIDKKQFRSYKCLSRGKFAATIEIDYKDKQKKSSILILTKKEAELRKFDFVQMENPYIVKALQFEYLCKLQSYIIYTETGEYSLQDKISDKLFRQSPDAIESALNWIKQVTMGLKKLHSEGFVHLNIRGSCIMIFSDNRAKLGGFDFSRHSSTLNNSFEMGSESYYKPPESFTCHFDTFDGKKMDTWCLAILTIDVLTNNYLATKSNQRTTWLEEYATLYKILQAEKFKKIVRKAYPKSAKKENLDKILQLFMHTLKVYPHERPEVSEFLILLLEFLFLKDIDSQLEEEKIWKNKASFKELQLEMLNRALKNKSLCVTKKTKNNYAEEFGDQLILQKRDLAVKDHHSQPCIQANLSNDILTNIAVETKEITKNKNVITASDGVKSETFSEHLSMKKEKNLVSEISETDTKEGMMGDFLPHEFNNRNEEIKVSPFEHTDLELSENSSSENKSSEVENILKVIPNPYDKGYAKNDLRKNTNEENFLSKQKRAVSRQSDITVLDIDSKDINIIEKHPDVIGSETEKHVNQNYQEKTTRSNFTTQSIFRKVVSWTLDEAFYSGVMRGGSFINKLSKALTG